MNKLLKAAKKQQVKYLVIDDEIAADEQYQRGFINDIALSDTSVMFTNNCEDALNIIKQDSEILFCFLDCKLPRNRKGEDNFSPQDNVNPGINLIPQILEINQKFPIIVFSAYVGKAELEAYISEYASNIINCLNKNEAPQTYRQAFLKALDYLGISLGDFDEKQKKALKNTKEDEKIFDYEQLDDETKLVVEERLEEIKKLLRRTAKDIYDIGKYLTEIKQKLKHGQFYPWLRAKLNWSPTSAARFMKVYEKFKSTNLIDLDIIPSVLYELANDTTPPEAIQETIELAESGKTITLEVAKSIKTKHKEKKKKTDSNKRDNTPANYLGNISNSGLKSSTESAALSKQNIVPTSETTKQKILKVLPRNNVWQLDRHTVFCAEPNSSNLMEQLPPKIDLCLAFPPHQNWQCQLNPRKSTMIFDSEHQDLDYLMLMESIDRIIQISTSEQDNIVVSFIPHPMVLSVIHQLGCVGYIVDPDYEKCLGLVDYFSQMHLIE
jgi:CheY-like chemotaxis protein